jgi:geranylgeranylglycerol-phosphate geranylgeranyltransferase
MTRVSPATLRTKARALSDLIRLELPLGGGIGVIAGQIIALHALPTVFVGLMGFLTAFFVSGAAMISNDYFDREVDAINHPQRPLPSGRVAVRELTLLVGLFSVAGFATSAFISPLAFGFAVVIWAIAFLYNGRYKATGFAGNVMVALCVASFFIFGGVTVGETTSGLVWTFGVLAFVFDLGEEVAGDAIDVEGDRQRSTLSVARVHGKKYALRVSSFFYALFVLVSAIPFVMGWLSDIYLIAFVPTDIVLAYLAIKLARSHTIEEGRSIIRHLYLIITVFVGVVIALSVI